MAAMINQLLWEVDLKVALLGFGFAGALMIAMVGFGPAGAKSDQQAGPFAVGLGEFVIVGHGGGLGRCGVETLERQSWFGRLAADC